MKLLLLLLLSVWTSNGEGMEDFTNFIPSMYDPEYYGFTEENSLEEAIMEKANEVIVSEEARLTMGDFYDQSDEDFSDEDDMSRDRDDSRYVSDDDSRDFSNESRDLSDESRDFSNESRDVDEGDFGNSRDFSIYDSAELIEEEEFEMYPLDDDDDEDDNQHKSIQRRWDELRQVRRKYNEGRLKKWRERYPWWRQDTEESTEELEDDSDDIEDDSEEDSDEDFDDTEEEEEEEYEWPITFEEFLRKRPDWGSSRLDAFTRCWRLRNEKKSSEVTPEMEAKINDYCFEYDLHTRSRKEWAKWVAPYMRARGMKWLERDYESKESHSEDSEESRSQQSKESRSQESEESRSQESKESRSSESYGWSFHRGPHRGHEGHHRGHRGHHRGAGHQRGHHRGQTGHRRHYGPHRGQWGRQRFHQAIGRDQPICSLLSHIYALPLRVSRSPELIGIWRRAVTGVRQCCEEDITDRMNCLKDLHKETLLEIMCRQNDDDDDDSSEETEERPRCCEFGKETCFHQFDVMNSNHKLEQGRHIDARLSYICRKAEENPRPPFWLHWGPHRDAWLRNISVRREKTAGCCQSSHDQDELMTCLDELQHERFTQACDGDETSGPYKVEILRACCDDPERAMCFGKFIRPHGLSPELGSIQPVIIVEEADSKEELFQDAKLERRRLIQRIKYHPHDPPRRNHKGKNRDSSEEKRETERTEVDDRKKSTHRRPSTEQLQRLAERIQDSDATRRRSSRFRNNRRKDSPSDDDSRRETRHRRLRKLRKEIMSRVADSRPELQVLPSVNTNPSRKSDTADSRSTPKNILENLNRDFTDVSLLKLNPSDGVKVSAQIIGRERNNGGQRSREVAQGQRSRSKVRGHRKNRKRPTTNRRRERLLME